MTCLGVMAKSSTKSEWKLGRSDVGSWKSVIDNFVG